MDQQQKETRFDQMRKLSHEYAQAEAARVHLTEFRKSKKALLMRAAEVANPGISAVAQEREAYADHEYQELLRGLEAATEKALLCRHLLRIAEMEFEHWRTKQANSRAEMNLR